MSTIALQPNTTSVAARAKVAAGLALPLGAMNLVGAVVFWEWSWLTWVAVLAVAMGAATLAGAIATLRDRTAGVELLRRAMLAQVAFTLMKLVLWQELEAATFGAVALVILALARR
jgi:hypothetical protein